MRSILAGFCAIVALTSLFAASSEENDPTLNPWKKLLDLLSLLSLLAQAACDRWLEGAVA
jgi:hypothetical protein